MTDRPALADALANALAKNRWWLSSSDLRPEITRVLAEHETAQEDELRRLLWLNHHCFRQYGDDGEQQCNESHQNGDHHAIGPLDFKRDDLRRLASAICSMERWHFMRAESAEARCAQLEQAVQQWMSLAKHGTAEHERLRAVLKEVLRLGNRISDRPAAMGWKDIDDLCELIEAAGAALAPSQEPTT